MTLSSSLNLLTSLSVFKFDKWFYLLSIIRWNKKRGLARSGQYLARPAVGVKEKGPFDQNENKKSFLFFFILDPFISYFI